MKSGVLVAALLLLAASTAHGARNLGRLAIPRGEQRLPATLVPEQPLFHRRLQGGSERRGSCASDADCSAPSPCQANPGTCDNGQCVYFNVAAGLPCSNGAGVCDLHGACVASFGPGNASNAPSEDAPQQQAAPSQPAQPLPEVPPNAVPVGAGGAAATPATCTYAIQGGDTLYKVGVALGADVATMLALNPGVVPEQLQIGQVINVPCPGGLPANAATAGAVNAGGVPATPQAPQAPATSTPAPSLPPPTVPVTGGDGIIWGAYAGGGAAVGAPGPAYATYHYYSPAYETSSLYCADAFAPLLAAGGGRQLLEFPWTAYCNNQGLGPMTPDKCGKHLRVTNPATGQYVITTVVDMCGQGGVDMDPVAFSAIDGNGAGVRDGHMNVILEWV